MKLSLILAVLLVAVPVFAQPQTARNQQPVVTDDEVKVTVYKQFWDNRVPNPLVAYQAARDYMGRYSKEDDQYTRYLKAWMAAYEEDERTARMAAERADREQQLLGSFTVKNYAKAYSLATPVLTDNPNNLRVLIALGYGAVAASSERNEAFNAAAGIHAAKAIQLIESGKTPTGEGGGGVWVPFKSKEDVLGSLHYALGFYALKPTPDSAIPHFIKAAQVDADRRNSPTTYSLLALAYQNGPYKRLEADYTRRFGNQPESPESKAALDGINKVIDKMIDAYARAVALAGTNPQNQAAKALWMTQLTNFYKFRNNNSDAGLTEFIAGVAKALNSEVTPSIGGPARPSTGETRDALTGSEIFRQTSPSVAMLITENASGKPVSLGSGFFVTPTLLVTNYHVIKGASRVNAKLVGQTTVRIATIVTASEANDLAVLRIDGANAPTLPLGSVYQVGDEIYAVGNPEGLEGTFSQGIISAVRGTKYIQITAAISHGSSGGPVLNKRGEVIGVAVGAIEEGQNLNFAINVTTLKSLLSSVPR